LQGRQGGYPTDIHAIYNVGTNPIVQGSDVRKGIAAYQSVDFAVSHEMFLTTTARQCDVVLPAAGPLEKEDIGIPWSGNSLLYKAQLLAPRGQARSDYDILCDLSERLGFGPAYSEGRSASDWVRLFIEQSEITDPDEFRRTGIYWGADQERVGLADFTADPRRFPLSTPSGLVEIASQDFARERGGSLIPTWQPAPQDERFPLQLITPKSPRRTHSQGSNIPEIREKEAHALELHPQDAAARGIRAGDRVRLFNDTGEAQIVVRLSNDLMPGVACLLEGIWPELDERGIDRAGSSNMFSGTQGTTAGTACIMNGMGVQVELLA